MLCDSLARHDDPEYVCKVLRRQLLAYFDASVFGNKRILDFGCGSGASTFCMATMFPQTEVVGVELDDANVRLAEGILSVRRLPNVQFHLSTDANSLAPDLGSFDFVMLSAVYEHLLPGERRQIMPLLWSKLKDGGFLFVNGTPHRYFPYEHHSTGLWFVNYLPDRMTMVLARNFSKMHQQLNKSRDWKGHLRGGIRGGN
jgi:2-polyprenyl-3-methyl-5-hydroxy-6-metoxy-1,4-benzoquinol methylase